MTRAGKFQIWNVYNPWHCKTQDSPKRTKAEMGTRECGLPRIYYDPRRRKKKSHKLGGITVGSTLSTLGNPRIECDAGFQTLSVVVYREGRAMWKYSFLPFARLELRLYYLLSSHPLHHQVETGSSFQEASTNPRSPLSGSLKPSSFS